MTVHEERYLVCFEVSSTIHRLNENNIVFGVHLEACFPEWTLICFELCLCLNVIKYFLLHLKNASSFIKVAGQERSMLNTLHAKQASLKAQQLLLNWVIRSNLSDNRLLFIGSRPWSNELLFTSLWVITMQSKSSQQCLLYCVFNVRQWSRTALSHSVISLLVQHYPQGNAPCWCVWSSLIRCQWVGLSNQQRNNRGTLEFLVMYKLSRHCLPLIGPHILLIHYAAIVIRIGKVSHLTLIYIIIIYITICIDWIAMRMRNLCFPLNALN